MRWGGLVLALGLGACAPQDPAQQAERNVALCAQAGLPAQRLRACSAVIADRSAPAARRAEALVNRGAMRAQTAQYARAIADFGRALRLDPNNAAALLERGIAHQDRGAYDAAVRDFDAALVLQPNLQMAAQRREQARAGAGDAFQNQISQLSTAIASAPTNASLLNGRCWLRATNGQELELALADCNKSLRIEPGSAAVLDSRGLVNYKLGRFAAALADYDAALAAEPNGAHFMYGRGAALVALGRDAEGRALLAQATRLDASVADLYQSYGVAP